MLADETETLEVYRRQLRQRVPRILAGYDELLDSADEQVRCRAILWGLENTQVGVKKVQEEVTQHDEFAGRTNAELEFFIVHGRWPDPTSPGETEPVEAPGD